MSANFSVYVVIMAASVIVVGIGVLGLLLHRNPIRMLISLEVSFNGVLLLVLYLGWILKEPVLSSNVGLFAVGVSSGELALMVSIIMALFRKGYLEVLDQEEMEVEEK
ncbi:MAG: NADH-quinone oxidoreductase subunit K [Candidatus Marsarchaeota archaeon]